MAASIQSIPPVSQTTEDPILSQAIHELLPDAHRVETGSGATVVARSRGLDNGETPVLVMIHGYPQSMNMFRYIIPILPGNLPLFVLDIPGYGESTYPAPTTDTAAYSKRSIGNIILEALRKVLDSSKLGTVPRQVILLGHDRGARIIHRLAVDAGQGLLGQYRLDLRGVVLLDIVPTIVQFASLVDPAVAAGTFHWPFLAAPSPLPENMIAALGGDVFVSTMIMKWAGASVVSQSQISLGLPVYASYFKRYSVIAASCADYRAGALVDAPEQGGDQRESRKITCPTYVMYSEDYLGSRYDVGKVWNDWVEGGKGVLKVGAVGNGAGHFLCEEAPEEVAIGVMGWIRGDLGVRI